MFTDHSKFLFYSLAILVILSAFSQRATAQDTTIIKQLPAIRLEGSIKIDGDINEEAWKNAPVANGFRESRPVAGGYEENANRTEVKILYDDFFIYVSGYCHEKSSDSIQKELVGRDVVGNNDFVGVIFDTYYDKINASGFYLTPLGEQYDAKYSNTNGEDESWNAVWFGESKIINDGWTFEMRIPYSALRFSKNISTWGLNIIRQRNKSGKQLTWNFVDPTKNGFINQEGLWTGISEIKPPFRLSLSPYFSTYVNHFPYNTPGIKNSTSAINGGMDLKYGIDQNYTLDMTLVPDFGQVQSDRRVLNLSPFEVVYNENRPFFTEGLELFNKGNLFYSRRIGGEPLHKNDINGRIKPGETIIKNPTETKLLNGTKISGRNEKGLGLGFFNALSNKMEAVIEVDSTKDTYTLETSSLTNYNILVADQTLKNNSSVTLINTSVIRNGSDYDATVTAFVYDLYNKTSNYNLSGKFAVSNLISQSRPLTGYTHDINFSKNNGRFNYSFGQSLANEKYDNNDLGLLFNNNYVDHFGYVGYKWVKPTKYFNNLFLNFSNNISHRYADGAYQGFSNNLNFNSQLKSLVRIGAGTGILLGGRDYYEPRIRNRFFIKSNGIRWSTFFSSNGAKKYFYDAAFRGVSYSLLGGRQTYLGVGQRYRFNSKFSLSTNFTIDYFKNNLGFAALSNSDIIFSRRNRKTSVNDLNVKYSFNNKMVINMGLTHYWSQVKVNSFYTLLDNGKLEKNNQYAVNKDFNVNLFNLDMVYTWQFAPGSFINLVWKNAITSIDNEVRGKYFGNLSDTFSRDQNNNISLKILYYIDYNDIRKKFNF